MTVDQVTGPLRAITPLLVYLFMAWGLDEQTAGLVVAAVVAVVAAGWSFYSNRPAAVVTQASKTPDVKVVVGLGASAAVQAVAADPNVPNVIVKPPNGGL